mmetsp:Transcript_20571/g.31348  ORF Transcript_20571/g.31348 Transcript_20571/m.31348 type:complete len:101 (+) Transcript_20571:580-882(+)
MFLANLYAQFVQYYCISQQGMVGTLWICIMASWAIDFLVVMLAIKTAGTDPSDQVVRHERYCRMTNQHFAEKDYEFFCHLCNAHVNPNTKHCGRCQRCTS